MSDDGAGPDGGRKAGRKILESVFFFFVRAGRLAKPWVWGGVERN